MSIWRAGIAKQNDLDRDMLDVLRARQEVGPGLRMYHRLGRSDPLLWIPDAVAGAVGARHRGNPTYEDALSDYRLRAEPAARATRAALRPARAQRAVEVPAEQLLPHLLVVPAQPRTRLSPRTSADRAAAGPSRLPRLPFGLRVVASDVIGDLPLHHAEYRIEVAAVYLLAKHHHQADEPALELGDPVELPRRSRNSSTCAITASRSASSSDR